MASQLVVSCCARVAHETSLQGVDETFPSTWMRQALELANRSVPLSTWTPQVVRDFAGQRLSRGTMKAQLDDELGRARRNPGAAIERWATAGRWPRLQKRESYVLVQMLYEALCQCEAQTQTPGTAATVHAPPWLADRAKALRDYVEESWIQGRESWLNDFVQEEWDLQENMRDPNEW